jgi:hypothetical protein
MSVRFLVLHSGDSVTSARPIAVSLDPQIVREFSTRVIEADPAYSSDTRPVDPVAAALFDGRNRALHRASCQTSARPYSGEEGAVNG